MTDLPSVENCNKLISIIIVNYRVPDDLRETLRSIQNAELYDQTEIIVVDNASEDDSKELITGEFPGVNWIQLKHNIGFGKACNVGVQNADGTYILLLNPDTIIAKNTLTVSVDFMRKYPDAGLMGPKILSSDGTLQASCKRGFPTPSATFYHFTGLSRLFPKSKRFGRYNLTFMNPDNTGEVDAISGSFMFLPRNVFLETGGFDEQFFMYGEDLDLCYRIHEKGYSIWYHPETQIIHKKGKSSSKSVLRSRFAFYEAMILFSRKHKKTQRTFFPGWTIFIGILIISSINIGLNLVRHFISVFIDLIIINTVLWGSISLRFSAESNPYHTLGIPSMLSIHTLLSLSFIFMYAYNGIYSKRRFMVRNALLAGLLATTLFSACIYFVKSFALSRIAFAVSSVIISFLLVGWRTLSPQVLKRFRQLTFSPEKIILVGKGIIPDRIIRRIEKQRLSTITGIIWDTSGPHPGDYQGYPVLGSLENISNVLLRNRVDSLIVATKQPWYSHIIDVLSNVPVKNITIQWVPDELMSASPDSLPDEIPLRDFSV